MKLTHWFAMAVAVAFVAGADAAEKDKKLPAEVASALEKAEALEVYSLDGEKNVKDGWHGAKVLGKTAVKGDEAKKAGALVVKGVADGETGARCFIPRHGVRVTHEKKTYDLVICFECHWVYVYTDGATDPQQFPTSAAAEKALNGILTAAKVPLAKPEK